MIEAAIAFVESSNRPHAIGDHGKAVGLLQIHPDVVTDVNSLRREQFTLADRLDPVKSKRIFVLYCVKYAAKRPASMSKAEFAARLWHRGPSKFNDALGTAYWVKVRRHLC